MTSIYTGRLAIIITTNLPFTRWEVNIKDKALVLASVDKICYKAHLDSSTMQDIWFEPYYSLLQAQR